VASNRGCVFDIEKFGTHDGPGIRTVVFMKGCPLRCLWCHNPEGQRNKPEVMWWEEKCVNCKTCIRICPLNAIIEGEDGFTKNINKEICNSCGKCIENCPNEALSLTGWYISSSELVKEIEKNRVFYQTSGGGVTISGGEPFAQPEFIQEVLRRCKERGIHTTVDTSGYTD